MKQEWKEKRGVTRTNTGALERQIWRGRFFFFKLNEGDIQKESDQKEITGGKERQKKTDHIE